MFESIRTYILILNIRNLDPNVQFSPVDNQTVFECKVR